MSNNIKKKERRTFVGTVVSNKMEKTATVKVSTRILHKLYKKYVVKSIKYKFHDEQNVCNIGDLVSIRECRHISKDKYFTLDKVLKVAEKDEANS